MKNKKITPEIDLKINNGTDVSSFGNPVEWQKEQREDRNLIGLWVNLSRAYEIALLGNLSITIVYNKDYPEAADDYKLIKEFYKGVDFVADGDLFIEITKPYDYNTKHKYETLEHIYTRVERAKSFDRPIDYQNESSSDALMRTAVRRLNLSLLDVDNIKTLATVIAQLANSKEIRIEHLAEAIQYRALSNNISKSIIAESNTLMFGNHIKINKCDIDLEDVQNAIDYLQSLL